MVLDSLIFIFLGIGPWFAHLAILFIAISHKDE